MLIVLLHPFSSAHPMSLCFLLLRSQFHHFNGSGGVTVGATTPTTPAGGIQPLAAWRNPTQVDKVACQLVLRSILQMHQKLAVHVNSKRECAHMFGNDGMCRCLCLPFLSSHTYFQQRYPKPRLGILLLLHPDDQEEVKRQEFPWTCRSVDQGTKSIPFKSIVQPTVKQKCLRQILKSCERTILRQANMPYLQETVAEMFTGHMPREP